ncbi:hypothetical protein HY639_04220 [Candidatus Woesearchaeota archaeon]|nr:hypothetical protein [Candidatus Woesearchaeota archaeon]
MKRGQLTLFSILGIMLLLFVALYFFAYVVLKEKPTEQAREQLIETAADQPIKAFVDSCVAQTARMALFFFGFVGGDVEPPAYPTFFSYDTRYKIPYLYELDKAFFLTPDFVQGTLGRYVESKLRKCLGGFTQFAGVQINDKQPKAKVTMLDTEVVFAVTYPVTVLREGKKSLVGPEFSTRVPSRLKDMVRITNDIVAQKQADPTLIHWDYLTEVTNHDYNATAYAEVDQTLIYRLIDTKYDLLGEPYIFQFAVKVQ